MALYAQVIIDIAHTNVDRVFAYSIPAEEAVVAGNVRLHGDAVTHLYTCHIPSNFHHIASGFMTDNGGRIHSPGGPLVPIINMYIAAADGCHMNFNQNFIIIDLWNRKICPVNKSGTADLFYDSAHFRTHDSSPLVI